MAGLVLVVQPWGQAVILTTKSLAELAEAMPHRPGTLVVFTAGASPEHAARVAALGGRLVIDHGTMARRARALDGNATSPQRIEAAMGSERVRCVRNHVKAVVAIGLDGEPVGWLGSPNLNRINRPEQTEPMQPGDARMLLALADRLFERGRPGIKGVSQAAAYNALQSVLGAAQADGARVHTDTGFPLRFVRDPGLVLVERAGMGDAVLAAARHVGRGAVVHGVTWSMSEDLAKTFGRRLKAGAIASMSLHLPARFGRRKPAEAQAVLEAGVLVSWTPAHAKIAVVRGPDGVVTLSGGCNFTNAGQLDAIVVRHGEGAAREAEAAIAALPAEAAPEGLGGTSQPDFFSLLAA